MVNKPNKDTAVAPSLNAEEVWQALESVSDPEIPVLSVIDMGIITDVRLSDSGVTIKITPTFIGCPALEAIKQNIREKLAQRGFDRVEVLVDFTIAWTSNRMSENARTKLEKFGLAPPAFVEGELTEEQLNRVRCPHCKSTDTTLRSAFGSTLCRAIRFCFSCRQSFEQFKPV